MTAHDFAMANEDEASEAAKEKFREALERKREQQSVKNGTSQKKSKVQHTHAAEGGKRQFRRKSGSS